MGIILAAADSLAGLLCGRLCVDFLLQFLRALLPGGNLVGCHLLFEDGEVIASEFIRYPGKVPIGIRIDFILRNEAYAAGVAKPKSVLGVGRPLFSSLTIPLNRLYLIPRHASAIGVAHTQSVLALSIPQVGSLAIPLERLSHPGRGIAIPLERFGYPGHGIWILAIFVIWILAVEVITDITFLEEHKQQVKGD